MLKVVEVDGCVIYYCVDGGWGVVCGICEGREGLCCGKWGYGYVVFWFVDFIEVFYV